MIDEVEFASGGALLRGLLFRPGCASDPPVVIMAHGTSATIRMVADEYAQVFRRNGLAVLLYDHRNLGASDGEPRQEINPWIQCRGYLDAIDFLQTVDGLDHGRIGLWGDSYSGGQVLVVGAVDDRVTAIVAQTPVCGSQPPDLEPSRANFDTIRTTQHGVIWYGRVGDDPRVTRLSHLPARTRQAFRWFIEYGARHGTGAPFVTSPTLMMVAPNDEMTHANYDVARLAYQLMPAPKQWHDIAGGHFGLLDHPGPLFDEATRIQTEFLQRWLTPVDRP